MTAPVRITAAEYQAGMLTKKKHKYRAKRETVDGINFASKAEAREYGNLKYQERAGLIRNLKIQPRYPLVVNGVGVGLYIGDFSFDEKFLHTSGEHTWRKVCTDAKGMRLPLYVLKIALARVLYPSIEFREVRK
jgi:hypothetical protein